MKRKTVGCRSAIAFALCTLMAAKAAAVQVTLNLVQSQSFLTVGGGYAGYDFYAQDDPAFPTFPLNDPESTVTDLDPAHPSNRTTLTGTITVDVDNVLAPTTIQILSANMDATVTGVWLPEPQPNDGATSAGTIPAPAQPADVGIKLIEDFGIPECCDIAYAVLRDLSYNLATQTLDENNPQPIVEPVNLQGQFSSLSQVVSYRTGFFEYWADPYLINERDRDPVGGDGAPNHHFVDASLDPETITPIANAPKSTYVVSGNLATLTIPVDINISNPTDISYLIDGQFVATFTIPSGSDGDHNEDGFVNAADYVAWRKLPVNYGGESGYDDWRKHFGQISPGAGGGVPEPTSGVLLVVGLAASVIRRRAIR